MLVVDNEVVVVAEAVGAVLVDWLWFFYIRLFVIRSLV